MNVEVTRPAVRRLSGPRGQAGFRGRGLPVAIALALTLGGALAACSGGGGSSDGKGDELTIGLGAEALPNPALATSTGAWTAIQYGLVYAPLIHMTSDGDLEPALADSWNYVEQDGAAPNTVFDVNLRPEATFADGGVVTPEAVAQWFQYFVGQTGPLAGVLGSDPKFAAVDADTVRITMTEPNPSLPTILSDGGGNITYVVSPEGLKDPDALGANPHGAGPYVLDSSDSVTGDHYTYLPNEKYFDQDAIEFDKVEIRLIPDPSARLAAQQSGQLDVAIGDSTTAGPAEDGGLEVIRAPRGVIELVLDSKNGIAPRLEDARVRQAINYAIDRRSIAEALLGDADAAASTFLPTDVGSDLGDYYEYDPDKARTLLSEAGAANGFTLKALVQGSYFGQLGEPLMRAVAQNLSEVGITLDITSYATDPEYAKDVFGKKAPVFALTGLVADSPTLYGTYLAKDGRVNFFGEDKTIAEAYAAGARAEDPSEDWTRMWERFAEQAYVAPIIINPTYFYVSEGINGVHANDRRPAALPIEWSGR